MGNKTYSKQRHLQLLIEDLDSDVLQVWHKFGYKSMHGCFINRVLLIYKIGEDGAPEITNRIMITDFQVSTSFGMWAEVKDLDTGALELVGHSPSLVFGRPIFMFTPLEVDMRWELRSYQKKKLNALSFVMMSKSLNHPKLPNIGNYYVETPRDFLRKYPSIFVDFEDKVLTEV